MTITSERPLDLNSPPWQAQRWPICRWLALDSLVINESRLPTRPAPKPHAGQRLRGSRGSHWSPVFAFQTSSGMLVVDGVRRVAVARRRGYSHIVGIVGHGHQSVLDQLQALDLPI